MKTYRIQMTVVLFLVVFLVGCAPSPVLLHPNFGNSVRWAQQSQILNPAASENFDPVVNLHGRSATKAMVQYEKSFDQKQKQSNKIGILVTPGGK